MEEIEMYGLYSATNGGGDYYLYGGVPGDDRPLMSPEGLLPPPPPPPPEYGHPGFSGSYRSGGFGGYDELSSVLSEAASINVCDEHHSQFCREDDVSPEVSDKAKIKSHPLYPRLLQVYIDSQKVGAPPEIMSALEEIRRENDLSSKRLSSDGTGLGADPELDEFMETYIDMLVKYKLDLERPFDEATSFLNEIELQLSNLSIAACFSDDGFVSSDDEFSGGEVEARSRTEDCGLKARLLRKFGSHISSLKLEFSKKKKKGKLPKEARQTLLEWWKAHYKWPYPTEVDKKILADSTGLDQKQINNWFINQRKRHWKPSEHMQFGLMDNLTGQFYNDD